MRRITLRTAAANKIRMLLTVLSVALGTAYISGSLILTQSLEESFASIVDSGVDGIDVGLVGSASSPHGVPLSVAETLSMPAEELPESLDALLDIAYEAADSNPVRAIAAYRRALARYPEDSYMPYLIIELSTLYKNLGDYDAALALLDEALALPVIAKNAVMLQEFQHSRNILTVVSHMLTAQGTPALPFGEVPKELLMEADRRAEELTT